MPAKFEQSTISDFPTEFTKTAKEAKTMAKKNAAKKPATKTKKENKTMKNEKPAKKHNDFNRFAASDLKGQEWITATMAAQDAAVAVCREMYGNTPKFEPQSLFKRLNAKPGKEPGKLNRDSEQLENLGIVAHDLGWDNPDFLTESNVRALGGKIKENAFRFLMTFNIGTVTHCYYVVNVDDVEWPNGIPTAIPEKPKKHSTRRAPKAAAPDIAKLEAQIAEMKTANEALAAQNAQTTAILAALAAKLGV